MRRRDFVKGIVWSTLARPVSASAQQPARIRVIAVLMSAADTDPRYQGDVTAFRDGIRKLGWVEGRNIRTEVRWAALDITLMNRLAEELVAIQPDVILSNDTPTTEALLQQTRTLPVVFATVSDPIGSGFVASLPKPGGNATGFATIEGSLGGKWVELLKEIAPHVERVSLLFNPITAPYYGYVLKSFNAAAVSHGMQAITAPVKDITAVEAVAAAQANEPNGGLVVLNEDFTIAHREEIVSLIGRYRLPAVYPFKFFAEIGGLASYGIDLRENFQRAASYVDRILKGEKPTDLPVQAPTKFELAINLKTRQPLGSMCPPQC